ncbi:MAG TPA: thioredoxin family protein [Polyangiaceae bacterium]
MLLSRWFIIALATSPLACRSSASQDAARESPAVAQSSPPETEKAAAPAAVAADARPAKLGEPAPDFTLPDLDGKPVKLSSFRGKTVVLEWFNPECPFVKASHTKGSLIDTAARLAKGGTVWLAVNSGAPGKQGAGAEKNRSGKESFKLEHPILLDETGAVGRLYGAKHTPHIYVIDAEGKLVYRGAIDNSPDGEADSPAGGKLVRYVEDAVTSVAAGKPIAVAETEAYGCSVKYSN